MSGLAGQTTKAGPLVFISSQPARDKQEFFSRLLQFAAEQGWAPAIVNEAQLILEEWITNVISYGVVKCENPFLRVEISLDGRVAQITIEDNGIPFDPTEHPEPDFSVPPEDRPIGGLGIYMMKNLSNRMAYERRGERNLLRIEKDLLEPILGRNNR